jgi:hypothetical protein
LILAISTSSSVRPECQLYRVNCRVRCNEGLGSARRWQSRSDDSQKSLH